MPRTSAMPAPGPITGLELLPAIQGGGPNANVGIPLLGIGAAPRGSVLKLRVPMTADMSDTADANPGAGKVRWDDVPGSAGTLYINDADGNAASLVAAMAALQPGGFVYLQGVVLDDRDNVQKMQVDSVTDAAGYTKVAFTQISIGGAFADGDALEMTLQQPDPLPGLDRRTVNTVAIVANTATIDHDAGDFHTIAVDDDLDDIVVDNLPGAGVGIRLELLFVGDGSVHAVTWPAGWDWGDGNTPPDLPEDAGGKLVVSLVSFDNLDTAAATAHIYA